MHKKVHMNMYIILWPKTVTFPPQVGEKTSSRSEEQCPVDISKTGITLINNMVGLLPVGIAAYAKGEIEKLP